MQALLTVHSSAFGHAQCTVRIIFVVILASFCFSGIKLSSLSAGDFGVPLVHSVGLHRVVHSYTS